MLKDMIYISPISSLHTLYYTYTCVYKWLDWIRFCKAFVKLCLGISGCYKKYETLTICILQTVGVTNTCVCCCIILIIFF